jgi:hypothetical protein
MEAEDTEAIKRLVESGFTIPFSPNSCGANTTLSRISGRRTSRGRGLALAMVRTEYPRKLTVSIAEFLRSILAA